MPKPQRTEKPEALAPVPDEQPSTGASVQQDENRGLAGRLLDLRTLVEENRRLAVRDFSHLGQRVASLEQLVSAMQSQLDKAVEEIRAQQRDLGVSLREGGEQVRKAGEIGRKMTDQVKVLEQLREDASDPHEVIKPLQRGLAHLKGDVEALAKTIDLRFEQYPRPRGEPVETRDASEDPIVKMGNLVRDLKNRIVKLEAEAD
jgi:DNA repair exonuclease SbcCD ATPase subunit